MSDSPAPWALTRWVWFVILNLLSIGLALAALWLVGEADFLDGPARSTAGWLQRHPGWASWGAAAPLLISIAIGVQYVVRARHRRQAMCPWSPDGPGAPAADPPPPPP